MNSNGQYPRPDFEPLLTAKQVADLLGVSERYVRDSAIPRLRLPGRGPKGQPLIRFRGSALGPWTDRYRTDREDPAIEMQDDQDGELPVDHDQAEAA